MAKPTAQEIVDALQEMTLLEAKELVDLICDTFGVFADDALPRLLPARLRLPGGEQPSSTSLEGFWR